MKYPKLKPPVPFGARQSAVRAHGAEFICFISQPAANQCNNYDTREEVNSMAYKDNEDFHNDYPNGYSKNGDVYDGNGNKIGYVTGDGDYRTKDGQLYHNH